MVSLKSDQKYGKERRLSALKIVQFRYFLRCFLSLRNAQVTFAEKPPVKINSLNEEKHGYLIQLIGQSCEGNRYKSDIGILHEGSFEITLTVPLTIRLQDV